MELYKVRRFESEEDKMAYVDSKTLIELFDWEHQHTPEVLKLHDGRTMYTLWVQTDKVCDACEQLMAYFGAEIHGLPAIIDNALSNAKSKCDCTNYTVEGDDYTCNVAFCPCDIRIALWVGGKLVGDEYDALGCARPNPDDCDSYYTVACDVCGQDIDEDEEYWRIEGDVVCSNCLRDYAEEYFWRYRQKRKSPKINNEEGT